MDRHGNVTWAEIEDSLGTNPGCDKLQGYWAFTGCQYHKGAQTCAEPNEFADCPLPRHPLRNGRLNQTAYSLFLFIRDIADGDIVGWIDRQLADHHRIVHAIAAFDDFCHANDPYKEHDFGSFEAEGETIFFKIDYFDRTLTHHSPDPADPAVTERVITIMLADEY